jgi:alkylation response protein AidB-like acyl-CoA dehydrogenase
MEMNCSLPEEHIELRARARDKFASIRDRHRIRNAVERATAAFEEVWPALGELGFPGFLVPEAYGGNGSGLCSSTVVLEELATQGFNSFAPILSSMGAAALGRHASGQLRDDVLPQIARGDARLAIASTEADAGFNVLEARTFAEKRGNHYRINGSKLYISGADIADYLILVARTIKIDECIQRGLPRTAGISLFLVEAGAGGIERAPVPSRGEGVLRQFALSLKDVIVPAERLIGDEHAGAEVMFRMFNPERTLVAAMALGMSRYCLDLACEHARTRTVFGDTPIGEYQSIQHPLAELAIRLDAVRMMTYRSATLFDEDADPRKTVGAANSAKFLAANLAVSAVDAAIDVFGGKGFDEDHGIIHLWEQARLLRTVPISNSLILNQVAQHRLDLPRSY